MMPPPAPPLLSRFTRFAVFLDWSQLLQQVAANSRSFSLYAKLGFEVSRATTNTVLALQVAHTFVSRARVWANYCS